MLQVLDAAAVRRWCSAGLAALRAARDEVDALNVYPVPDGDTGTNLLLTMQAVEDAVAVAAPDMASTARAVARGGLMGARGNSGVILSQLLRGFCEAVPEAGAGPEQLRACLTRAADLAYAAVATPVEGTVLTVARAAADGAVGPDLAAVVRGARAAAVAALARTPDQLQALRDAGVVDAGGRGLCVLLEALEQVVTGEAVAPVPVPLVPRARSGVAVRECGSEDLAYEVQFLLRDAGPADVDVLKGALSALGDSLVVVGVEDLWNVHVHVDDVGAALEAAVEAGRPFRITVTRFADQAGAPVPPPAHAEAVRAVVAVAPGPGLAVLFRGCGATAVGGGPTGPSTAEVVAAVHATGAREVLVLPNDGNVLAVARAAAAACADTGLAVEVVPTRSVVQGLAALAVADDALSLADCARTMSAAAEATRWAEVTTAVRDATTAAGPCRKGDALGLLQGEVVEVGGGLLDVADALLARLLAPGAELVTVLVGAGAPPGAGERLAAQARAAGAEVTVYDGGQPHYPLLLGAE
ncbi:MAG: Dak phosphatase [Frankiales bacterium]|nr:Dak phosphatase [Frankiales bacterium]